MRRSKNTDRKLVIMRRADTHRDAKYGIGGRLKLPKEKITLPRVPSLEKPDDDALQPNRGEPT